MKAFRGVLDYVVFIAALSFLALIVIIPVQSFSATAGLSAAPTITNVVQDKCYTAEEGLAFLEKRTIYMMRYGTQKENFSQVFIFYFDYESYKKNETAFPNSVVEIVIMNGCTFSVKASGISPPDFFSKDEIDKFQKEYKEKLVEIDKNKI